MDVQINSPTQTVQDSDFTSPDVRRLLSSAGLLAPELACKNCFRDSLHGLWKLAGKEIKISYEPPQEAEFSGSTVHPETLSVSQLEGLRPYQA